jgi:hypothetical protein
MTMLIADRERRLRLKIDQLRDELDEARQRFHAAEGQLELLAEAEARIAELEAERRVCTSCGVSRPLDDFHLRKDGPGGRSSRCKACHNVPRRVPEIEQRDRVIADLRLRGERTRKKLQAARAARRLWRHRAIELADLLRKKEHALSVVERAYVNGGPYHGRPSRRAMA